MREALKREIENRRRANNPMSCPGTTLHFRLDSRCVQMFQSEELGASSTLHFQPEEALGLLGGQVPDRPRRRPARGPDGWDRGQFLLADGRVHTKPVARASRAAWQRLA